MIRAPKLKPIMSAAKIFGKLCLYLRFEKLNYVNKSNGILTRNDITPCFDIVYIPFEKRHPKTISLLLLLC